MAARTTVAGLLLAVCLIAGARAKLLEGHVTGRALLHSKDPDMVVIGSFGFECITGKCGVRVPAYEQNLHEKGVIHIEAHADPRVRGQQVAAFSSDRWHNGTRRFPAWTEIYRSYMSCEEKLASAIFSFDLDATAGARSNTLDFYHPLNLTVTPLFVYVVAMNCASFSPGSTLALYYRVELLNPGGWWGKHFSYEDQGMLQMRLTFFLIALIMAASTAHTAVQLHAAQLSHPPLVALSASIWCVAISEGLAFAFYADYATHGFGPEGALVCSEVIATASDLGLMVLFLVIAQGWRLSDEVPPPKDQMLIGGAVIVYVVCYTIIYAVDYALRDPASEVYVLLTTGAYFLVAIRIMLFMLCGLFFFDTYRREPSVKKTAFFRKVLVACALWFLQMPITCILVNNLSHWVQHRVATAVIGSVSLWTLGFLLYCFQPERAKDYFTIQVTKGEMEGLVGEEEAGGDHRKEERQPSRSTVGEYIELHEQDGNRQHTTHVQRDEGML